MASRSAVRLFDGPMSTTSSPHAEIQSPSFSGCVRRGRVTAVPQVLIFEVLAGVLLLNVWHRTTLYIP